MKARLPPLKASLPVSSLSVEIVAVAALSATLFITRAASTAGGPSLTSPFSVMTSPPAEATSVLNHTTRPS